jgi:uncharacterized protein
MQSKPDMQAFVIAMLKEKLPPFYYYHNHAHTLDVLANALEIGRHEACSAEEMELLHAAALWHDTGHIIRYNHHEEASCALARQYLPGYGFTATAIDRICGMIMATQLPQSPHNTLEAIIADADLAYLGTDSAAIQAGNLYKELLHRHPSLTEAKWNKTQLVFLQMHHYFTKFCKETKEPAKQQYLQQLQVGSR